MPTILARQPRDLTVAWAQRVVARHHADIVVDKVEVVAVDVGTTTRVRVKVVHTDPQRLPEEWFVKLPSLAWQARLITALPRLLHTEVRFYNEVAQSVAVSMPPLLAAESRFGKGATLVLADLSATGASLGQPRDALSFAQAAEVVVQLAGFHARFWGSDTLYKHYGWLAGPVRRLEDFLGSALAVPLMKRGLSQAGALVPTSLHAGALHYARQRKQAMRFLNAAPHTLVHHDCHPGNLFWHQSQPGFLDWQLIRLGEGISDIAYLLATALLPETRRAHEAELLALYVDGLTAQGVKGLDAAALHQRYRAHLAYPFEAMVVTLAIGGMMNLDCNRELIRRTALAVADHEAFSALPI